MRRTISRSIVVLILLLLALGLAACNTGGEEPKVQSESLSGAELVSKMEEAVKATKSAHLTVNFQVASAEGPVKGTIEFWGERPGKMRAEVKAELPSIDGIVAVTDGQQGWAYNAREKLVLVGDKSQYKSQLRDQPELRSILEFAEKIVDRGFTNTEAVVQGTEQVNGRNTHKVQVTYAQTDDPELDLSGITATFWIDQETFLPQRVEMTVDRDGFTASGLAEVQGDMGRDAAVDAALFTFTPPPGTTVMDLSKLPELPAMSNLPQIQ